MGSAKDELCTVGDLCLLLICFTCVNSIGKHNGLVHLFRAMPVHSLVCKSMKRCLVMVKVWITRLVVLYAYLWNVAWPCFKYGLWNCIFVAGLRPIQCIIIRHVLAAARDEVCKVLDLHTFAAHLWSVAWPWLKYGLWRVLFFVGLRSIPRIIIKHALAAAGTKYAKS